MEVSLDMSEEEKVEIDKKVVEYVNSLSDFELNIVSNYIERESIKEMKDAYSKDEIKDIENKINKLVSEFIDRVADEFSDYDAIVMIAVGYALKKSLSRKNLIGASYLFELSAEDLLQLTASTILNIFGKVSIVDRDNDTEYRILRHDDNGGINE